MAPSSMGAFRSACFRLRTASMKLAQLFADVLPRRPRRLLACRGAVVFAMVFVPHRQVSLGSVENSPRPYSCFGFVDAGLVIRDPVRAPRTDHLLFAVPLSNSKAAVRVFGVSWSSSNMKWPPMALTLVGYFTPEAPARHVHLVHALVADVAVAVIPEPVPVVVEPVLGEFVLRAPAQPQIVMHARRNRRRPACGRSCRAA